MFVHSDPISTRDFERLQGYVRGMLERATGELRANLRPGEQPRLVGTSGTIESLMTLHTWQTLGHAPASLQGYTLTHADLKALIHKLQPLNYHQRCQVPGMSEKRAEIILAGAVVLSEVMNLLQITSLKTCDRALREGMIVDWMLSHGLIEDRLRYQGSVRQRSTLSMAQKFQVNLPYSERVANFALSLFDQTQGTLHEWGELERELLWSAAILHNCGHFVSHSAHHKHSYYLIRHGGLLGYTDTEIELIANLARYHRKSSPKKKHENYRQLTTRLHRLAIEQLSPILRLAIALDRRQVGAIRNISCQWRPQARELTLILQPSSPDDPCELELWSLNYKKELFETVFNLKLAVSLETKLETKIAPVDELQKKEKAASTV